MRTSSKLTLAGAGLLLLGGCASVTPDAAFSDVQKTASERLGGKQVQWNRGTPEDKAAQAAVARLLESPLMADSAVQIALLNNRRLQAEYENLGIAQADLVQAGLLANPSFSMEILTGNGAVSPSFSVVQDFFTVLTLSARRTVASGAFARAKYDVGNKILDVAAEVRSAYYKLLGNQQAAELFRQVVSATEAAAELAERQVLAGNLNRRDQAIQQAQYAQAVVELARTQAQIASDRENVNRLLGLYGEQIAWNVPDRLPDVPAAKPPFDDLETAAIEHRLDLAGARAEVQTATSGLDLGRQLRWFSVLGLGVRVDRDPDSGKWLKGPTVEFTLPVFHQGQARVAALHAERRRSEKAFAALAIDVRSEIREAYVRMSAAQDGAAFYKSKVLPLHRQIVQENQRLYNGMLIGIYDLLRSRQEQINAARNYIGALSDYWVARSDLEKALAGPLPIAATASAASERHPALIAGKQP
jgi:cobalt-zinc-cadmium efflux system outer membrane protein